MRINAPARIQTKLFINLFMQALSRRSGKSYKTCEIKTLDSGTKNVVASDKKLNRVILMLGVHHECRCHDNATHDDSGGYRPQQYQGLPAALPRRILRKEDFTEQNYDRIVAAVAQLFISY